MNSSTIAVSVPLHDRVVKLARMLRGRGFNASIPETLDAIAVLDHVDLINRYELREGLRAALVKQADERSDFDACFDRHFPRSMSTAPESTPGNTSQETLVEALGSDHDLGNFAAGLVDQHGGFDGEVRGERHHVQRVLRAIDLARLMMLALRSSDGLDVGDVRARLEELKRLITEQVRGRLGDEEEPVDDGGADSIEFLRASRFELERMRALVQPLARQIATKLARRRQHAHSGRIEMRRTVRRSLATGGVPFDLATHRRKPQRPELFVLSDISGSVAEFSLFTLTLMSALSAELSRTRSFVFVDAIDEITALLARTSHGIEPWQIMRNTNVIGPTGHSDYGRVFQQFWTEVGESDLGPRSTVIITGDGRSNYQPAETAALRNIAQRSKSVFWLNPEQRSEWGTFDSDVDTYAPHCRKQFEVSDLHQLAECVEHII